MPLAEPSWFPSLPSPATSLRETTAEDSTHRAPLASISDARHRRTLVRLKLADEELLERLLNERDMGWPPPVDSRAYRIRCAAAAAQARLRYEEYRRGPCPPPPEGAGE